MKLSTLIYNIPVVGWMLKSAARNGDSEKIFFLINIVLAWILAIITFGFPALIIPAVTLAIGILAFLVIFTAGDLRNSGEE